MVVALEFQKNFGKESNKPRAITKFPITVFQDFEPDGALTVFLKECLLFQSKLGLSEFDIPTQQHLPFVDTLKKIHTQLVTVSYLLLYIISSKSVLI